MSKIGTIIFTWAFCSLSYIAQAERFVINPSEAVSDLKLRNIRDAWDIISIDYPRSKPIFMYTCNGAEFFLFDLNKDNKFVIFNSPNLREAPKIKID
jgi:hypothetical protein